MDLRLKGSGTSFDSTPDTLNSNAIAEVLDIISVGEIEGFHRFGESGYDIKQDIYLNQVAFAYKGDNGQYVNNFDGIYFMYSNGGEGTENLEGTGTYQSTNLIYNTVELGGVELSYMTPIEINILVDNSTINAIDILFNLPNGLYKKTSSGIYTYVINVLVDIAINKQSEGDFLTTGHLQIDAKTSSAYTAVLNLPLNAYTLSVGDIITLKFVKTSFDTIKDDYGNEDITDISLYSYTKVYSDKLVYPKIAKMYYKTNALLSGLSSMPTRHVRMGGILVDVPNNYEPISRAYTGDWNGGWHAKRYTNNPAWFIWWLLTNKDWGLGNQISQESLSSLKWELYELAKWCDEEVPSGYVDAFGSALTEPRFTLNVHIKEKMNAFEFLRKVCGSIRTLVYFSGKSIHISPDMYIENVARVFTQANVIDGRFLYSETPLSSRHSVANAYYYDMNNFCVETPVSYEDRELIEKVGVKSMDIDLFGCNSAGQALRACRFALFSEKFETKTVSFTVGLENCTVALGEVVGIMDNNLSIDLFGGRLTQDKDLGATTFNLDKDIRLSNNYNYDLIVIDTDLNTHRVTIGNSNLPNLRQINVSELQSVKFDKGSVWGISQQDLKMQMYRIMSISENDYGNYAITALQYDNRKYAYIENDVPLQPLPDKTIKFLYPPSSVAFLESLFVENNIVQPNIQITWDNSPYNTISVNYELKYKIGSDANYGEVVKLSTPSFDLSNVGNGLSYQVAIRCVTTTGLTSGWFYSPVKVSQGLSQPMPDVTGVNTYINNNKIVLTWLPVVDVRGVEYEVRRGDYWNIAQTVYRGIINEFIPQSTGTYLIKAVSNTAESINAELVIVQELENDSFTNNVVVEFNEHLTGWSGTKTNMTVVSYAGSPSLFIEKDQVAYYELVDDIVLSYKGASKVIYNYNAIPISSSSDVFNNPDIFNEPNIFGIGNNDYQVMLQYQAVDNDAEIFSDNWRDVTYYDIIGKKLKFRLKVVTSKEILLYIETLNVRVDVPDRRETHKRTITGQTTIQYNIPFNDVPTTVVTLLNGNEGERMVITNETTNSFTVAVRNSSNAIVTQNRDINIHVEGY